MIIAFYKVGNSLDYERHSFDALCDEPEKVLEMLKKLPDEELKIYDANNYGYAHRIQPNLADFEDDYNDEELDGGWWSVVLKLSFDTDELDTAGLLSIMASLIRSEHITSEVLLNFIKGWKEKGLFDAFVPEHIHDIKSVRAKVNLAETIIKECMKSKELRINLQMNFGQFDGAQICENCGRVMWTGYSWAGITYCDDPCVLEGESIDKETFDHCLKDAEDPDGCCYYTEWY